MKITFDEFIKRIAEEYREDAEELECETAGEVFKCYMYDSDDLKEEIFDILQDLQTEYDFEYFDDGSIYLNGEDISFRKIASALRKYKF